ncbi:MAG: hypothetical protein ACRYG8_21485 [Janthinobacterium lividum]
MAHATKPTSSPGRKAVEAAPKKRLGRPPGSKNKAVSKPKAAAASVAAGRAAPKRATAAVAPTLNKAELEQQIIKLERTIARLRKQNAELKTVAREEAAEVAAAAAAPRARRATTAKPRRAYKKTAPKAPLEEEEDAFSETD